MSKVIRRYFVFALLHSVIVPGNLHQSIIQSDAKLKSITTWPSASSRALSSLVGFTSSFHWLSKYFRFFWLVVVITLVLFLWHFFKGRFKPGYLPTFGFWGRRRETSHFQENKGITDRHRSVIILSWFIIFRTTQVNHQLISLSSNHLIKHTDNYTMTSVCISSILFSIHFLRCWQGEFV